VKKILDFHHYLCYYLRVVRRERKVMKVGDLVRYKRYKDGMNHPPKVYHGIVLELSKYDVLGTGAGLMKVLDTNNGEFDYYIPKHCEVVNEAR